MIRLRSFPFLSTISPLLRWCAHVLRVLPALVFLGCQHGNSSLPPSASGHAGSPDSHGRKTSSGTPHLFRDVAQEVGLNFRWGHDGKSPLTIIETLGHGTAFLDYDQDGLLDILLVGNRRLALYRNLGNGRFEDVTHEVGLTAQGDFYGVAVGDYDNDGYPDLYITGYGKCILYHNTGKRKQLTLDAQDAPLHTQHLPPVFEDVTEKAGVGARSPYDCVTAAAFVDLDGDGKLDLFAGRYIVFKPGVAQFCMYGGVRAGCGVRNYDADGPQVYRNNGDGTFTNRTKIWGFDKAHGRCLGVAIRATEEGKGAALYLANDEMPGDLFVPRDGGYAQIGLVSGVAYNNTGMTQGAMGVDWGDFLNEGRPGLVITTFQSEPDSLYRGDAKDLYSEVGANLNLAAGTTGWVGWTAKFLDYDNDGWLDLLITNGHSQDNAHQVEADRSYAQPMLLYHNEQGRQFQDVSAQGGATFHQPFVGRGGSIGDFDNDGRVDALLVDEEGAPKLLHNEARTDSHWLGIHLIGTKCNRDGIGTRVLVTAGGKTFLRDQQLAGGYLSAHDPRLHFGLGAANRIEKIVVRWPDGHTDTIKDAPLDTYIEITEARGLTKGLTQGGTKSPVYLAPPVAQAIKPQRP